MVLALNFIRVLENSIYTDSQNTLSLPIEK